MNHGNQVKTVMICIKSEFFLEKRQIFPKFLASLGIFSYLCHRQTYRERFAPGAVKDARVTTQGIFYAHTFRDLPEVSLHQ